MKSNRATRQENTFNKNTNPLKLCTQVIEDKFSNHNEKKLEQTLSDITSKINDYSKDLITLMLIILIPTIPFWQL